MPERHSTNHTERRPMRRAPLVAGVIGATLLSGAISSCTVDPGAPASTIASMAGRDPIPHRYFGTVEPKLDCRLAPQDDMKSRIAIDGRMNLGGRRIAVSGSSWYGEITVYYDGTNHKTGKYVLSAHGAYVDGENGPTTQYATGVGTSQNHSSERRPYETGYKDVESYPLPDRHTSVLFYTTDQVFQLGAVCMHISTLPDFHGSATLYDVPYHPVEVIN